MSALVPDASQCDSCWTGVCADHDYAAGAICTPPGGVPVLDIDVDTYLLTPEGAAIATLLEERDEYRRQATAFVELLVGLGHGAAVDRVLRGGAG